MVVDSRAAFSSGALLSVSGFVAHFGGLHRLAPKRTVVDSRAAFSSGALLSASPLLLSFA